MFNDKQIERLNCNSRMLRLSIADDTDYGIDENLLFTQVNGKYSYSKRTNLTFLSHAGKRVLKYQMPMHSCYNQHTISLAYPSVSYCTIESLGALPTYSVKFFDKTYRQVAKSKNLGLFFK